jgi:hypothetical protein
MRRTDRKGCLRFVLPAVLLPVIVLSMVWILSKAPPEDYERLADPAIVVHNESDLMGKCKTPRAKACAIVRGDVCHIYIGPLATDGTMAHEMRHCHGWAHGPEKVNGHWQWHPKPHLVKP